MNIDKRLTPDYIFESSWEVCNKVGGIYTVLATRANSLQKLYKDHVFFVGPDIENGGNNQWFKEDKGIYREWLNHAFHNQQLMIRAGRWDIPGKPLTFLVRFDNFMERRDDIYRNMWVDFAVDSLAAYGDYHHSTIFAYTAGLLIESFYRFHNLQPYNVIAHFNEWMLGAGALYIKKHVPKIATIFTTHATSIGRSIAGNNLPLYIDLNKYNGDITADELNMTSKHSIEKHTAHNVDCFTTVSEITATESEQLLGRRPDVVTPNGFDKKFIPKAKAYERAHKRAREVLLNVAEKRTGQTLSQDSLLIGISGRYEYKNKGIDLFIDALKRLNGIRELKRDLVGFIMVPSQISGPREDLQTAIFNKKTGASKKRGKEKSAEVVQETRFNNLADSLNFEDFGIEEQFTTHKLVHPEHDPVLNHINHVGLNNSPDDRVKIVFVPSYLNGADGIFNLDYYNLLIGLDMSLFPSYYEPWGYTPHESIAFSIPTITTSLSGFGVWARGKAGKENGINSGVKVINRDDNNYSDVVEEIVSTIYQFTLRSSDEVKVIKEKAAKLSDLADWAHFITYYREAYAKALHNSFIRLSNPYKLKSD